MGIQSQCNSVMVFSLALPEDIRLTYNVSRNVPVMRNLGVTLGASDIHADMFAFSFRHGFTTSGSETILMMHGLPVWLNSFAVPTRRARGVPKV
jgi:hypothetical protein